MKFSFASCLVSLYQISFILKARQGIDEFSREFSSFNIAQTNWNFRYDELKQFKTEETF